MPTYVYECPLHGEIEKEHSIMVKLEYCFQCEEEDLEPLKIKRLCAGGSGKGIVELTGQDLVDKTKSDIKEMKKEIYNSEKKYSNFIGENNYQKIQKRLDSQKK